MDPLAPGSPQGPLPIGPRDVFPGPPPLIEEVSQDEEEDDEAMESGALTPTGAGVGFIKPTKRKLVKASAVKRMLGKSAFSKGRMSSLIVKAASLSTQYLVLLQEQESELSKFRQNEDKNEVQVVAEQESVFRLLNLNREGLGNEDNFLNSGCCAGPRCQAGKVPLFPCYVFFCAFWHESFFWNAVAGTPWSWSKFC